MGNGYELSLPLPNGEKLMDDIDCFCDYEPASVYEAKDHIARKQHKCTECNRPIWPGEVYEKVWAIWEMEPTTCKTCIRCLALREFVKASVPCFCWAHHNIIEDAMNTAEHYRHEAPGLWFGALRRRILIRRNERLTPRISQGVKR